MSLGGLDPCACKRGFFTLRDCGQAATATCAICSRRVCQEHLAPEQGQPVCVECAARQEEQAGAAGTGAPAGAAGIAAAPGPALGPPLERLTPTASAVFWRTRYYRRRNYGPMWWGTRDPYWNDWGYRWYDDDDDDDGGFGDS